MNLDIISRLKEKVQKNIDDIDNTLDIVLLGVTTDERFKEENQLQFAQEARETLNNEREKLAVINSIEQELNEIIKLNETTPSDEHEKDKIPEFIETHFDAIQEMQKKLSSEMQKDINLQVKNIKESLKQDNKIEEKPAEKVQEEPVETLEDNKADDLKEEINPNLQAFKEKLSKDIQLNSFLLTLLDAASGTMTPEEYNRKKEEHQNNLTKANEMLNQLDYYIKMRAEETKIEQLNYEKSDDIEVKKAIEADIIRRKNLVEQYRSKISPELMSIFRKQEQTSKEFRDSVEEKSVTGEVKANEYANLTDEEINKRIWHIKENIRDKVADENALDELRALREELKTRGQKKIDDMSRPVDPSEALVPTFNDPQKVSTAPVKDNEALVPIEKKKANDLGSSDLGPSAAPTAPDTPASTPTPPISDKELFLEDDVPEKKKSSFFKKALIASAGFVTGVGLSCVPGVGTIRMTLAAAKLIISAAHAWSDKHPNGRVAKICDWFGKWREICPNIASDLDNVKARLKGSPINVFINGVSAGYITGNIFELFTGKTVLEAIKTAHKPVQVVDNIVQPQYVQQYRPIYNPINVVKGQTYDISALEFGKVSSDATNSVHLLNSVGKTAVFDKEVILANGTKMWHFKQANGLGYAWFNADDVINTLRQGTETVSRIAR